MISSSWTTDKVSNVDLMARDITMFPPEFQTVKFIVFPSQFTAGRGSFFRFVEIPSRISLLFVVSLLRALGGPCCIVPGRLMVEELLINEEIMEVDVAAVSAKLKSNAPFLLLDCREQAEWNTAKIEGATLLPMSELRDRAGELEPHRNSEIVVYCHHGVAVCESPCGCDNRGLQML